MWQKLKKKNTHTQSEQLTIFVLLFSELIMRKQLIKCTYVDIVKELEGGWTVRLFKGNNGS